MKTELAVLPLEVWTDVFVYPWITRQQLAQIVDQFKDRKFAEKLQFRLHDMGKQSLHILDISSNPDPNSCKYQLRKRKILDDRASLTVARSDFRKHGLEKPVFKECEFAQTEMPENIKKFKQLNIKHFDDDVLDFLDKLKPLFTNVFLDLFNIGSKQTAKLRILFGQFLPMVASIRAICCNNDCIRLLEKHFSDTLAMTKELPLTAKPAFIPSYLRWLSAPLDFGEHGRPRLLVMDAESETLHAIVEAVRKQFLAATTTATFAILLEFDDDEEQHHPANEFKYENTTTNEQLAVRNAIFEVPETDEYEGSTVHYVEILRHPTGAETKMWEWLKQRAFYEKATSRDEDELELNGEADQIIWIKGLTIGRITKRAGTMSQGANEPADGEEDEAGPSISTAKKMRK